MTKYSAVIKIDSESLKLFISENGKLFPRYIYRREARYAGFKGEEFLVPSEVLSVVEGLLNACPYSRIERCTFILPHCFFRVKTAKTILPASAIDAPVDKRYSLLCRTALPAEPGYVKTEAMPIAFYDENGIQTNQMELYTSATVLDVALKKNIHELFNNIGRRLRLSVNYCADGALYMKEVSRENPDITRTLFLIIRGNQTDIVSFDLEEGMRCKTVNFGADVATLALVDLLRIGEAEARSLLGIINLNLPPDDSAQYYTPERKYPVREINLRVLEAFGFLAKKIASVLLSHFPEISIEDFYLVGSDACKIRGLRELFEYSLKMKGLLLGENKENETLGYADYDALYITVRERNNLTNKIMALLKRGGTNVL